MVKTVHDHLVYWDHVAWFYLNVKWHNSFFDWLMPFLRNQWFWMPVYLFLLLFIPSRYGRNGWIWCGVFLITFGLSDQISASLIKPFFHRVRPCNNDYLMGIARVLVPCGSGQSFPSSHAANHFSLSTFMALSLGRKAKWIIPLVYCWAFSVIYSQVYVGVHYPLDVTAGGLLGVVIGFCTGKLFNKYMGLADEVISAGKA